MKVLKVLHLASFSGNIGDNANHSGTRHLLKENLDFRLEYTELEMREFYWKQRAFDKEFVALANQHDLLMIGGGNYFEMWVDSSSTGTSVDISREVLDAIKCPILFYALGCDPGQGVSESNLAKFKSFLDLLFSSDRYLVSVRNDGSLGTVMKLLGEDYARRVFKVPDGGFFTRVEEYVHPGIVSGCKNIGINVAGDMLDIRFKPGSGNGISYEDFLNGFSSLLNEKLHLDDQLNLVFFPHIFRDLNIISDVLERIEDPLRRKRVMVAPYLQGAGAQEYIFDMYRKCDMVLGMRFHANVCPIGLNVPTIGLVNYVQIENLYRELDLEQRMVHVNQRGFEKSLSKLVDDSLNNIDVLKKQYTVVKSSLIDQAASFHREVNRWLHQHF